MTSSSLGKLVEGFLGVRLDKSAQLTDWTRRPLPEAELDYAASDVAHLLALRDALLDALERRGRLVWAEEEIERLRDKDRSTPDPQTLWWKLRGKTKLNGRARGVAQELAMWREEEAKRRNRPPRTVLSDMALLALAQRPARSPGQLRGIRGFDARRFKKTDDLLAAIARGLQLPRSAVRTPPKKPENLPSVDGVISLCMAWLAQRASEESLDVTVLGTRDDVTNLIFPGSQGSDSTSLENSNISSVFRYKHDFGRRYTVGVIATDRDQVVNAQEINVLQNLRGQVVHFIGVLVL